MYHGGGHSTSYFAQALQVSLPVNKKQCLKKWWNTLAMRSDSGFRTVGFRVSSFQKFTNYGVEQDFEHMARLTSGQVLQSGQSPGICSMTSHDNDHSEPRLYTTASYLGAKMVPETSPAIHGVRPSIYSSQATWVNLCRSAPSGDQPSV